MNAEEWDDAAEEFGKWVWGGGRKLPGLVRRRAAERGCLKMSWGEFYIWTVWAMAGLNLLTGIGCLWNKNWEHGGMFIAYAVACVFIVFQVTKAQVR